MLAGPNYSAFLDLLASCGPSPRRTCALLFELDVGLWLCFLLRTSLASEFPPIVTLWRRIGCLVSRRNTPLMSMTVRDAMSPGVISVALAPPRFRMLPCLGRERRIEHIPCCPCLDYVIRLHARLVHVVEEFMG
jgi:hypothetical protein